MENGKLTKQRTKHYYFISKYCHSWHNTNNHTLSLSRMVCWSIHCICRRVSVFSSSFIHSWIVHFNQTSLVAIKLWSYSHTENRHKHRVTQTNNNHNNEKKTTWKKLCLLCMFFFCLRIETSPSRFASATDLCIEFKHLTHLLHSSMHRTHVVCDVYLNQVHVMWMCESVAVIVAFFWLCRVSWSANLYGNL